MCNMMCFLSEWDEYKPRDCANCSGNYSSAGAILLPQQITRMAWQRIGCTHKVDTQPSGTNQPRHSYTRHRKATQTGTRQVSSTGYRRHRV